MTTCMCEIHWEGSSWALVFTWGPCGTWITPLGLILLNLCPGLHHIIHYLVWWTWWCDGCTELNWAQVMGPWQSCWRQGVAMSMQKLQPIRPSQSLDLWPIKSNCFRRYLFSCFLLISIQCWVTAGSVPNFGLVSIHVRVVCEGG